MENNAWIVFKKENIEVLAKQSIEEKIEKEKNKRR